MADAHSSAPRRFLFDRAFVDHMRRDLLCDLLAPYEGALAACGIALAELRASTQNDRRIVERLYDAAHRHPAFPADARALFVKLAPLATASGQAALLRRDAASPAPRFAGARLPPADLTARVHLEVPQLLDEVRVATDTEAADTFTDFSPASPRAMKVTPDALARFEATLSEWLVARARSPLCRTRITETAAEILFVIEIGSPARSFDMVGEELELVQVNGVTAERALAVFDKESCGVGVHGSASMKDVIRRSLGEHFFGDVGHFTVGAVYSLEPLRNLDVALDPKGVPGLEAIELRHVALRNPDDSTRDYAWSKGDLRESANAADLRAALAAGAAIVSVKLYLRIEKRARWTSVTLSANRKKYLRRADDVERVLNELLLARGIMKLPAREDALERTG